MPLVWDVEQYAISEDRKWSAYIVCKLNGCWDIYGGPTGVSSILDVDLTTRENAVARTEDLYERWRAGEVAEALLRPSPLDIFVRKPGETDEQLRARLLTDSGIEA